MKVAAWPPHFQFHVVHATHAVRYRRAIQRQDMGIRDHANIGSHEFLVLGDPGVEVFRGDLFLALDEELHIDRQFAAVGLHDGLYSLDLRKDLALVVGYTARINFAITLDWLEWRGLPFFFGKIGRASCRE